MLTRLLSEPAPLDFAPDSRESIGRPPLTSYLTNPHCHGTHGSSALPEWDL
jgi:hypothetical protein